MTGRKRERPLYLNMDFGEALQRFAQTDPKEVKEAMERAKEKKPPGEKAPRRPARKKRERASPARSRQDDDT